MPVKPSGGNHHPCIVCGKSPHRDPMFISVWITVYTDASAQNVLASLCSYRCIIKWAEPFVDSLPSEQENPDARPDD